MTISKFKKQLKESSWKLGICINGLEDLRSGNINWINNGQYEGKKWFADPFILDYSNSRIDLLVEEFDYGVHRGRIAHIVVDRLSWTVISCDIVLDLATHLSFPAIYRIDNKIFVCPENYTGGVLNLYLYNQFDKKLEFVKTLYNDKLTDATLVLMFDKWYMLSTFAPTPNGNNLTIYSSKTFQGPYNEIQKVTFDENIGRNAGQIFIFNDTIIRPAQECNQVYGHSIVFQKVLLNENKLEFKELFRYNSTHPVYNLGAHTYNQYKGMAVIDVKGYRYGKIARLYKFFENFAIKIGIKQPYIIK